MAVWALGSASGRGQASAGRLEIPVEGHAEAGWPSRQASPVGGVL